jgi:hypothetical protein
MTHPAVIEEVARALFAATHDRGVWDNVTAWGQHCRDDARRLAAVAVGAYRATQDGGAEEAVRRVSADLVEDDRLVRIGQMADRLQRAGLTDGQVTEALRITRPDLMHGAALAPQVGDGAR